MTSRLYYADSYLTEFTARPVSIDGTRVYLDRTAFYPTSGGQRHDLGALGGVQIVDVVDEEARVAHVLASAPTFAANDEIIGTLDWPRRFDSMQQHTGQHLLSAIFEDAFGYKTESVHFGDESATLDLDTEMVPAERLIEAERCANQAVLDHHAVTVVFENAATAAGLRKPSERDGEIRVVSIDGLDRSACGGTHVRSTAEIGPVLVRRAERYKKSCRVEFLCGWRALKSVRADHEALSRMAASMSAAIEELPALVSSQAEKLRAAEAERRKLGDALARHKARDLYDATEPDGSGVRRLLDRSSSMDELRALAHEVSRLHAAVFVGTVASPPAVVFAASEDTGVNAGAVLKAALAERGGRGGGSPRIAQGTVPTTDALEALVLQLAPKS